MQKMFEVLRGTKLELPVLVAAFYGFRRGEVLGLKWGIHLLGKVMYQYYEDNYLAQICNSRNIIYIAGYISGRTEY